VTDTFTPAVAPSIGGSVDVNARTNEAPFGDGYVQAQPDGLNSIGQAWSLRWNNTLTKAQLGTILTFFTTKAGATPFLYTLPYEDTPRKWRCKKWTPMMDVAPLYYGLTAEFTEDFGL
jgi:phage-related protein